jgi:preprotein translocase subunit SecG
MNSITSITIISICIIVWLFICLIIYRASRTAAWLAGSTVASCLFLLGATVAISFLVRRALFLTPLWFGILVLALLHLLTARNESAYRMVHREDRIAEMTSSSPTPTRSSNEKAYI